MHAKHGTRSTGVEVKQEREVSSPGPDPGVAADAKPSRRTSLKGRSGVYFRQTAAGRKYEVSWVDSQGRRRWRTVPGFNNLADAQALLDSERGKTRRGERAAPAQAPKLADYADAWLDRKTRLRERTRIGYETNLRVHVKPRIGRLRVSDVREDDLVRLIREMEADGKSGATIQNTLVALGGVLNGAVRDGLLASNPIRRLSKDERPAIRSKGKRALDSDEIASLLEHATPSYRVLLATAAFTGLRQGEILGLKWQDVDFDGGFVHVRRQFDRTGVYSEPKTEQAKRSVVLAPSLARLLAEHRLASRHSSEEDPVFCSGTGKPLAWRNVARRGMEVAVRRAGLDRVPGRRRPSLHDLRDSFASMLISRGEDVVFVSRQLGHARPSVTLDVYADLFDRATHADRARASMESLAGNVLERNGGDRRRSSVRTAEPKAASLLASSTGGDG